MNQGRLAPTKKTPPAVRVTYSLTAADGKFLKTQTGDQITAKY